MVLINTYQYLPTNPKKGGQNHLNPHKLKKIENVNADISETRPRINRSLLTRLKHFS